LAHLFDPISFRSLILRNRIGVSPMCQYSSVDGFATDWHLVHLGARATGGAALVIMEATAVEPIGRISPYDHGLWQDAHIEKLKQITNFIKSQGAVAGIQLAHAGRKASRSRPWEGDANIEEGQGGWSVVGASAIAFSESFRVPHELSLAEIEKVQQLFIDATLRALKAGFQWLELHAAHGYLIHSFLSPLSNQRNDAYGGSFENRTRFLVELAKKVRAVWPENLPMTVRFSCSDWAAGGWTIEDSVALAKVLKNEVSIDLVDCSSGGNVPHVKIPTGPNYQVPFSETIRREAKVVTAAVGMITEAKQAEAIIREGRADIVLLARAMLRDAYWPRRAAEALALEPVLPPQYLRS
jgi:2,4-dienoyl-CoA reductase-like NADH-dependent reductase (Old Yellow Enzyme family)